MLQIKRAIKVKTMLNLFEIWGILSFRFFNLPHFRPKTFTLLNKIRQFIANSAISQTDVSQLLCIFLEISALV